MTPVVFVYSMFQLALALAGLAVLARLRIRRPALPLAVLGALLAAVAAFTALIAPVDGFGRLQLLTWAMFLPGPVFLLGAGGLARDRDRPLATICVVVVAGLLLVGLDAFVVEPRWLQVTHVTLPSDKLGTPLRVALLADLQTDAIGRYEERVLQLLTAEDPDLVLLAGDYLHISERTEYDAQAAEFNALIRRELAAPPLGIYAIQGNVDPPDWPALFAGLPVTPLRSSTSVDLGPLVLTGLSLSDSYNARLSIGGWDQFHIVLGHSPNFALGRIEADLLVAGHTHGGQVRLPLVGPLLTLSRVPRSWAAGVTALSPDTTLIVSRGIGMERGSAPRLRFLCRPELVIIDLEPTR